MVEGVSSQLAYSDLFGGHFHLRPTSFSFRFNFFFFGIMKCKDVEESFSWNGSSLSTWKMETNPKRETTTPPIIHHSQKSVWPSIEPWPSIEIGRSTDDRRTIGEFSCDWTVTEMKHSDWLSSVSNRCYCQRLILPNMRWVTIFTVLSALIFVNN